jgi:hypothetical protein
MKGAHKLTEQKVKAIVTLFDFEEINDTQIANLFDVSRELINHIRNGIRWSSVTGIEPKVEKQIKEVLKVNKPVRSNDFRNFDSKDDRVRDIVREELNKRLLMFL